MLTLNLLPEEFKLQYRFEIKKRLFVFLVLALCVITAIFSLLLFSTYLFLKTHESSLAASFTVEQSDERAAYIARTEKNIQDANAKISILEETSRKTVAVAPIIEEISGLVPDDARIKNISVNMSAASVSIEGFSTTRDMVLRFRDLLSGSDVVEPRTLFSPIKNILKEERVDFRFSFVISSSTPYIIAQ